MASASPPSPPRDLSIIGLSAGYARGFQLRDVTFTPRPGDVVGVIGPNGSGKSTLLRALAGVLPLSGGSITFGNGPLQRSTGALAFVPQREEVQWDFPVTAEQVVLMGRYRAVGWLRRPGPEDRQRAQAALGQLGLEGMGGRHISQFSGGQQQRVFLARAMVQDPAIVLLDEPFTGIDVENRRVFHQAISDFASRGVIVLMATHDLDEVASRCTHVCCLNQRLVAYGPTAETFTEATLRRTFGGQLAVFA